MGADSFKTLYELGEANGAQIFKVTPSVVALAKRFSSKKYSDVASFVSMAAARARLPFPCIIMSVEGLRLLLAGGYPPDHRIEVIVASKNDNILYHPFAFSPLMLPSADGSQITIENVNLRDGPVEKCPTIPEKERLLLSTQISAILAVINSPNIIEKETTDYSKLNNKRIRQGKPPLPDVTTIMIKREILKELKEQEEADREPGAKKRLHWRRGHFKHMPTGTFWYSACLVGAGPMIEHDYVA